MAKEVTYPTKEHLGIKISKPRVFKYYKEVWQNFEKMGKKINRLWKVKKHSFEILREERE